MPTVYDLARKFFAEHPERLGGNGPWATSSQSFCAALAYQFAAAGRGAAYDPALEAAHSAGKLNKNAAAAPAGAKHYFELGGPNGPGHVATDLRGGATSLLMASTHFYSGMPGAWGKGIGAPDLATYVAHSGAKYLGWSMKYGTNTNHPAADDWGLTAKQYSAKVTADKKAAEKAAAKLAKAKQIQQAARYLKTVPRWKGYPFGNADKGIQTASFVRLMQRQSKTDGFRVKGKLLAPTGVLGAGTKVVLAHYAALGAK